MPAVAALKGIILSITIITALGVAVLENPAIQAWLEQQRQNLIELLRQIGEELDPASRRAAEALAYQGRTPANDVGLRREASGSLEAAAVATGRSLSSSSTIRRIPVRGPSDPDEAEERRRKGREYLAQRNQQMMELKERRKVVSSGEEEEEDGAKTPTSFDAFVDGDGKLRAGEEKGKEREVALPSVPAFEPAEEVEKEKIAQPVLAESSSAGAAWSMPAAWNFGSLFANPFGDEYALARDETPVPPVPPKVALEEVPPMPEPSTPSTPTMPGTFAPPPAEHTNEEEEDLSYEEQLAIALSLSEAEAAQAAKAAAHHLQADEHDPELRAAIAASLKDMRRHLTPKPSASDDVVGPLVDLRDSTPATAATPRRPRWETFFDQLQASEAAPEAETDEDELYSVTPQLTQARLASLNSASSSHSAQPHDRVREAVTQQQLLAAMEASFYSAASSAPSRTLSPDAPSNNAAAQPTELGFETDSDSDTFASVSRARSEIGEEGVVLDVEVDSDVDMLSVEGEGEGIATPDSWTEVGSRDGEESEGEEHPNWRLAEL